MLKIELQKIIVLPEFLSKEASANTRRLVEKLYRKGDLRTVELLLSTVRVLQYQKKFYALEHHHLIAALTAYLPSLQVNLLSTSVNSKLQLIELLLTSASLQCVAQRAMSTVPSWHQSVADEYGIPTMFSMREWANIYNKNRTSVYSRRGIKAETQKQTQKPTLVLDIDSALKAIPLPHLTGRRSK